MRHSSLRAVLAVSLLLVIGLSSNVAARNDNPHPGKPTPTPSASFTPRPSPSPTATPTVAPSRTPAPSSSATPSPTATPTPPSTAGCIEVETQAWWRRAGIEIPTNVGEHVHLMACMPRDGVVITSNTLRIPYTVKLHNQSGPATWIRGCLESGSVGCTTVNLVPALGPCVDCSRSGFFDLDLSTWPAGRRELRLLVNIPRNDEGNRQLATDGWPICVDSCTAADPRGGIFWTMRGWYDEGHDYANVRVDDPVSNLHPGATIHVVMGPGSGGSPTTFSAAYMNSDMHHGDKGLVLGEWNGAHSGSITLPAGVTGRLVLVSSDGQNAGVGTYPVTP